MFNKEKVVYKQKGFFFNQQRQQCRLFLKKNTFNQI